MSLEVTAKVILLSNCRLLRLAKGINWLLYRLLPFSAQNQSVTSRKMELFLAISSRSSRKNPAHFRTILLGQVFIAVCNLFSLELKHFYLFFLGKKRNAVKQMMFLEGKRNLLLMDWLVTKDIFGLNINRFSRITSELKSAQTCLSFKKVTKVKGFKCFFCKVNRVGFKQAQITFQH